LPPKSTTLSGASALIIFCSPSNCSRDNCRVAVE
jgi:hypothetical protein